MENRATYADLKDELLLTKEQIYFSLHYLNDIFNRYTNLFLV